MSMLPVTQTHFGWPSGNCVQSTWATMLGVPLDYIPPLDPGTAAKLGVEQHQLERAWLGSLGYALVELSVDPTETLPDEVLDNMPPTPHLMSGISPRGYGHRVVGVGGRVYFDPHPSRAGLVSVYSVGLIVPLEELT